MEEKTKTNRKRRERAIRMRSEINESGKASEDSCEEDIPIIRSKPPRSRRKNKDKDPLFEESIVDGFAIMSFKSYEDIERCVRSAEKLGSRYLDPCPDRVKEVTKKKTAYVRKTDRGCNSSSGMGYICDSESEDEKGNSGESDFFSAPTKLEKRMDTEDATGVPLHALNHKDSEVPDKSQMIPPSVPTHPPNMNGQLALMNHSSALQSGLPRNNMPLFHPNLSSNHSILSNNKEVDVKPPIFMDQKPPYFDIKPPFPDQKPSIDQKPPPVFGDCKPPQPYLSPRDRLLCPPTSHPLASPKSPHKNSPHFVSQIPNSSSSFPSTTTTVDTYSIASISTQSNYVNSTKNTISSNYQMANGSIRQPLPNPAVCSKSNLGKYSVVSLVSSSASNGVTDPNTCPNSFYSPVVCKASSHCSSGVLTTSVVSAISSNSVPSTLSASSNTYHSTSQPSWQNHPSTVPYVISPKKIKSEPGEPNVSLPQPPLLPQNKHIQRPSSLGYYHSYGVPPSTADNAIPPSVPNSHPCSSSVSPYRPLAAIKSEPGVGLHKSPSPLVHSYPRTTASPRPPSSSIPAVARQSPLRQSPRSHELHSLYGPNPLSAVAGTPTALPVTSHSLSKPWPSPAASLPTSAPSHHSSMNRPGIPPMSFSSVQSHPSGPPSGVFAPPVPNPPNIMAPPLHLSQDPLAQVDILRRELDSRFLATQDRSLGMAAPAIAPLGAVPALLRTDVHHHQHQHTHVHQHLLPPHIPPVIPSMPAAPAPSGLFSNPATPSLFKEVNKTAMDSSLYHSSPNLGSSYGSGLTSLVNPQNSTPFTPPSHILNAPAKKTGIWNAMHVRLAWEIFYDQQKRSADKSGSGKLPGTPPDLLRSGLGGPTSQMYSSLPRPPDIGGSLGSVGPPSVDPIFGSRISPSVPRLAGGFRYDRTAAPSQGTSPFHHPGLTPTSISGPPPGSMFSRDPLPPNSGLSFPHPTSHDAWRLRTPTAFGPGNGASPAWSLKQHQSLYEREHEERLRREKEEREKKEREERERREREERERRERERERDKRAEHEKERMARLTEMERNSSAAASGAVHSRSGSRSPTLRIGDGKDAASAAASATARFKTPDSTRPPPAKLPSSHPADASKDDVMILGTKDHHPATLVPSAPSHAPPPVAPPHHHPGLVQAHSHVTPASLLAPPQSSSVFGHASLPPQTLPPAHYSSVTTTASPLDRTRLMPSMYPPTGLPPPLAQFPTSSALGSSWPDPFRDAYRAAAPIHDPLSAARAAHDPLGAARAAHDPLGAARAAHDHLSAARAAHDPLGAARAHELAARDALREQISMDRAAREHYIRTGSAAAAAAAAASLNPMVLTETYHREQQARELLDRERQMAAATTRLPPHANLYPPSSVYLPPGSSHLSPLIPPTLKTAPTLPPHVHAQSLNPAALGAQPYSLHPGPSHLNSLGLTAPGMLPHSLRGPTALHRPPDKKEHSR